MKKIKCFIHMMVFLYLSSSGYISASERDCKKVEEELLKILFDPSTKFKVQGGSNRNDEISKLESYLKENCRNNSKNTQNAKE